MTSRVNPGAGSNRWAMILARGDGMRLRSLTRRITGDERPKQFCPVIGGQTLLEQTWRRTSQGAPPERTLLVFYQRLPASDFSHDVLSMRASRLAVLPAHGLAWSDLGSPERVTSPSDAWSNAWP